MAVVVVVKVVCLLRRLVVYLRTNRLLIPRKIGGRVTDVLRREGLLTSWCYRLGGFDLLPLLLA